MINFSFDPGYDRTSWAIGAWIDEDGRIRPYEPPGSARPDPVDQPDAQTSCRCGREMLPGQVGYCSVDCVDLVEACDTSFSGARWVPELADDEIYPDDLTLLYAWPYGEGRTLRVLQRGPAEEKQLLIRLDNGDSFSGLGVTFQGELTDEASLRELAEAQAPRLVIDLDQWADPGPRDEMREQTFMESRVNQWLDERYGTWTDEVVVTLATAPEAHASHATWRIFASTSVALPMLWRINPFA